jgi:uncharacterized ferredoxin-like protein
MRRIGIAKQPPPPNVVTRIECQKCGFHQIRKFEKGDYVLKNASNCQKCAEPMLIVGIYVEEDKTK